jgi:hypothetical protein
LCSFFPTDDVHPRKCSVVITLSYTTTFFQSNGLVVKCSFIIIGAGKRA